MLGLLVGSVGGPPIPTHGSDEVRDAVESVLADPRYDEPSPTLVERVEDWFNEQLGRLFESLVSSGAGSIVAWIVIIAAVALLALLVTRVGRTVQSDATSRVATMIELTRSPSEWRAEADALEAAGRWKDALRCRYRALVGELVARGHIPELPGRTAGEYRIDVAARDPVAAPAFAEASDLFELAWYGDVPTGPGESARFRSLEAEVLRGVRA